jgi:hypothetical protein
MKCIVCLATAMAALSPVLASAQGQRVDKSGYTLFNPTPDDQLRDMATDRGNATNSPTTVDAGHLQIEGGFIDYERIRTPLSRNSAYSYGDVNLRLGVLNNLELNLIVPPHIVVKNTDLAANTQTSARGFGDITVGGKFNFWGNEGSDQLWATAFGVQSQIKLPTAKSSLSNGYTESTASLPFSMNLPGGFGLSIQPSILRIRTSDNLGYTTGYEGAIAIDHDIGPLNAYAEYVLDHTTEKAQRNQKTLNVGVTSAVSRNVVLDTGLAFGLNSGINDFRIQIGASVRF